MKVKGQLSDPYDSNPVPRGERGRAGPSLSCDYLMRLSDQRTVPQAQETSPSVIPGTKTQASLSGIVVTFILRTEQVSTHLTPELGPEG